MRKTPRAEIRRTAGVDTGVVGHGLIVVARVASCSVWGIWFDDAIAESLLAGLVTGPGLARDGRVASFREQEVGKHG